MSGTEDKRGGVSVRCSEEAKAILKKYAQGKSGRTQSERISMKMILDLVIPKVVEFDLYDPEWTDKLVEEKKTLDLISRLKDECPGLAIGKGKGGDDDFVFRCVWYQFDGPPKIKLLGRTESLQGSACASCDRTREIVKGLVDRDEKIFELETRLRAKAEEVFKAPVCNVGAILSAHGTQFSGCRRHPREPVSIDGFCRVYRAGLPCMSFAEVVIGVGAK